MKEISVYRKSGIGSKLLEQSEIVIRDAGYEEIVVGAGEDYLMPGVPTAKRYFTSVNEKLQSDLDRTASDFFEKRGYEHGWDCNCFDMRFELKKTGDTEDIENRSVIINGINYRWAKAADLEAVCSCTNEAHEEFTRWYRKEELYVDSQEETLATEPAGKGFSKVLIAVDQDQVVGTLIVSIEAEGKGLGSVGCTTVRPSHQGKHIAVNMVTLGTGYLEKCGMKEAFLGYTYSGLDHLYGYAGYKICTYYMMAKKTI